MNEGKQKKWYRKATIGGLVLSRKAGQTVVINNGELVIEVVQFVSGTVRLAFKASKEIQIHRGEFVNAGTNPQPRNESEGE